MAAVRHFPAADMAGQQRAARTLAGAGVRHAERVQQPVAEQVRVSLAAGQFQG